MRNVTASLVIGSLIMVVTSCGPTRPIAPRASLLPQCNGVTYATVTNNTNRAYDVSAYQETTRVFLGTVDARSSSTFTLPDRSGGAIVGGGGMPRDGSSGIEGVQVRYSCA